MCACACDMEKKGVVSKCGAGMYASLCVTFLSKHALFCSCWAWKHGGCQIREAASRVGDREGRVCFGRIWWGTLAGLGRDPGSRHQPQRKLVKWPRNVIVGMLQGRGRACGVWIGGWGRGAGRLEGWRQRQPFRSHVGRLFCENDDYDDYYDYSSYSRHSRAISHSRA